MKDSFTFYVNNTAVDALATQDPGHQELYRNKERRDSSMEKELA